jgi:gentisate 1,2-dioxygenase
VLDLPLVHYLEASYHVDGPRQALRESAVAPQARAGLRPTPVFERACSAGYPLLRYPWEEARAALLARAEAEPGREAVQLAYVHPETGEPAQNILGFSSLMLRPGQVLRLSARSPAQVFHLIEGAVEGQVEEQHFALAEADTCCAPGYTAVQLANRSSTAPAFVFIADESPLHHKLGLHEDRG